MRVEAVVMVELEEMGQGEKFDLDVSRLEGGKVWVRTGRPWLGAKGGTAEMEERTVDQGR